MDKEIRLVGTKYVLNKILTRFNNKTGVWKSVGKHDVKKLLLVILILILIDSVVFVITEGFGANLVINIVFYVLEILATIGIVKDNGNNKN